MRRRTEIQSFDFRTLMLFETQHPEVQTYYLTSTPERFKRQLEVLGTSKN